MFGIIVFFVAETVIAILVAWAVFQKNTEDLYKSVGDYNIVRHAGGAMAGYLISNCEKAFDRSYMMGFRFFETDICTTRDGKLVLSHGFGETDYLNRYSNVGREYPYVPDLEEFLEYKVGTEYETMSFDNLVSWMKNHRDTYFFLDIKECQEEESCYIASYILNKVSSQMLSRLIFSARTREMIYGFKKAGNIPYLHLLYWEGTVNEDGDTKEFIQFCKKENISSVSFAVNDFTEEVASEFAETDLKLYSYMVEDSYTVAKLKAMGINYFTSDYLSANYIEKLHRKDNFGLSLTKKGRNGIEIKWTTNPLALGYEIHRDYKLLAKINNVDVKEIVYLDKRIPRNRYCTYNVTAIFKEDVSKTSMAEMICWNVLPEIIKAERNQDEKGSYIMLTWTKTDMAKGYSIKRKMKHEECYEIIKVLDKGQTMFIDRTPVGQGVKYKVQAYTVLDDRRYYSGYTNYIEL